MCFFRGIRAERRQAEQLLETGIYIIGVLLQFLLVGLVTVPSGQLLERNGGNIAIIKRDIGTIGIDLRIAVPGTEQDTAVFVMVNTLAVRGERDKRLCR